MLGGLCWGWICLWGPGHISRYTQCSLEGEGCAAPVGRTRPACKQQTYRIPTLCKGLGGSWPRPDSEAECIVFPAEEKSSDSLCSLLPPGGSCWLWIKSMRGSSGLVGSLRLHDSQAPAQWDGASFAAQPEEVGRTGDSGPSSLHSLLPEMQWPGSPLPPSSLCSI